MRKCCCCGVKTGALLLGIYNLLISALVIIPLAGYWSETDVTVLNVLKEEEKVMEKVFQDALKDHEWTKYNNEDIMTHLREWYPLAVKIATVLVGVSALASLLLISGIRCKTRCLLLPWLFLCLVDIVLFVAAGGIVVVALFYLNIVSGVVAVIVYIILTVVVVYSWAVVMAAYRQLGNTDYIYSPAPVKPIYTGPNYYPSAPQHFAMEEYRDLREEK